jgi:hypothetical protein
MIRRLLLFGATGDLAGGFLLPALAKLHAAGKLPDNFLIVASSRDQWGDETFRRHATERLSQLAADGPAAQRDELVRALRDLRAAGFTADDIEVLTGEEGAHRVDVTGEEHGPLARFVRSFQRVLGHYEPVHVRRHEQELLAGHFGIGVTAKDPATREKVRKILKSHKGHFINFYGEWAMEVLEP